MRFRGKGNSNLKTQSCPVILLQLLFLSLDLSKLIPLSGGGFMSSDPKYSFLLPGESTFDQVKGHAWISDWFCLPVICSLIYLATVHLGKSWMLSRPSLTLRPTLVVWNTILAVFNSLAFVRASPELLHVLRHLGWKQSVCSFSYYDGSQVTGFWTHVFVLSKLAELLDTLFLVLRKRKVTLLHWFHHCSVLFFTWFLVKDRSGLGRWCMNMNAAVHSVMYTYYALMALQVKLPRSLALCITSLQIAQMVMGTLVSVQGVIYWSSGVQCSVSATAALSSVFIYGAYLLLFLNFFMSAYVPSAAKEKAL